jgi:polyisoprenoid-binding protein YceI
MKLLRLAAALLSFAPLLAVGADAPARALKIDRTRSFVDVDVSVTMSSFVAHLDQYDASFTLDDVGKVKAGSFKFKFTALKTGDDKRDAAMIKWLGGGSPEGLFQLGVLALAPDGQGVVNGNLKFHNSTQRIEFPVVVTQANGTYAITGETNVDYTEWGLKVIRKAVVVKVDPVVRVRFKLIGEAVAVPAKT